MHAFPLTSSPSPLSRQPSLRFLPAEGAFAVCDLWAPWLYNTFGLQLVGSVIVYRFARLYWILKRRRAVTGWRFKLLLPLLWLPSVVLSIANNILKANGPVYEIAPSTGEPAIVCRMNTAFSMTYIGYSGFLVLIFGALALGLRNVRHRIFNEYGRTLVFVVAVLTTTILYVVFIQLRILYFVWGRWIISAMVRLQPRLAASLSDGHLAFADATVLQLVPLVHHGPAALRLPFQAPRAPG